MAKLSYADLSAKQEQHRNQLLQNAVGPVQGETPSTGRHEESKNDISVKSEVQNEIIPARHRKRTSKVRVDVTLPVDIKAKLFAFAEKEQLSVSVIVQKAVEQYCQ